MTQTGSVQEPSLVRVSIIESRPGRVTIAWTLNCEPTVEWIAVFDSLSADSDLRGTVDSAYGRPLVMRDQSIIWSVRDSEVRAAISFVELGVTSTNDRLSAEILAGADQCQ
jgi:hypothetical protein